MQEPITIVSGLPRSGTSMMMRMLERGGLQPLTDGERKPDQFNPNGYYEFEKVKSLKMDSSWIGREGRSKDQVIKVISHLLPSLPSEYQYQVIFMERNMDEVLTSQRKMFETLQGRKDSADDALLAEKYQIHLDKTKEWIASQKNFRVSYVKFGDVVQNPRDTAKKLANFLQQDLPEEKMAEAVDSRLHRNRSQS